MRGRVALLTGAGSGIGRAVCARLAEASGGRRHVAHAGTRGGDRYVCRAAIPVLRDGGSIVNMASMNSLVAWENNAPYSASKGALLQFTRALALELAPRQIRVNCVCPGIIDTPLTDSFLELGDEPAATRAEYEAVAPLSRMGTAREVANCVYFLASDESTFVTGSALDPGRGGDGGGRGDEPRCVGALRRRQHRAHRSLLADQSVL